MKIPKTFSNYLLIATPTLRDGFFSKSVIYLYEHSEKGAMGVVVNKSLQITVENLLQHLDIEVADKELANYPVLSGGPVGPEQGFVLHDRIEESKKKRQKLTLSASKEILSDISQGNSPKNYMVFLGYSGWEQGQLEQEIHRNDWLLAPLNLDILFETNLEERWCKAAETIGVDINNLSNQIGHA